MTGRYTQNLVRTFIGAALGAALVACASVPVPEDLPAIAFDQAGLYRLQIALLVFYGGLLLITPAFSGLVRGRLPVEISARGAKFAEETVHSGGKTEAEIDELQQKANDLTEGLDLANIEINRLKEGRGDST